MKSLKIVLTVILLISVSSSLICSTSVSDKERPISIPLAGNSWVINDLSLSNKQITESGIENWTEKSALIRTYFRIENTGTINIALRGKVTSGTSQIEIVFGDEIKKLTINNTKYDTLEIGTFSIDKPGYQWVEFRGITKSASSFAEISDLLISGPASNGKIYYVKDDFYFGRRGPSVHMNYQIPSEASDIDWFYNEITVPEGSDVPGSYYMADGFADGYFGIQVNSKKERRILFSVWSPYNTDKPGDIPPEYKIILLKKGPGVITKEFGDEGSGGQSFRKYYWKTGETYRFLLNGHPSVNNSTDYSAYFFSPETKEWQLIASFRRPKTNNYLKNLYSFLENFLPETGVFTRKGFYSNQWVHTTDDKWVELTNAKFTADATAKKEARLDYSGGVENGTFFLRNCGFFNDKTEMGRIFSRPPASNPLRINLSEFDKK